MNLRTLKKLSKRAAPLLPVLGDHREQFMAARGENYTGLRIAARKHWERGRSVHDEVWGDMIKTPARDGNGWVYADAPSHPRKGTIMVGAVSGYYEPEWSEETAWEALSGLVFDYFTDWSEESAELRRDLSSPAKIFRASAEMIPNLLEQT